jgi:magnesium chelatase family protein
MAGFAEFVERYLSQSRRGGERFCRLVVPELNPKEATMVGGVEIYPVKSLLDVIRFVNTGNGILPLKVDSESLLSESPAISI